MQSLKLLSFSESIYSSIYLIFILFIYESCFYKTVIINGHTFYVNKKVHPGFTKKKSKFYQKECGLPKMIV